MNLFIKWDVDAQLIDGYSTPNLYGLLFVTGLILGYFIIKKIYKEEGIPEAMMDKLVMYMILSTIIGARLGHVFFYGPYFDGLNADGQFEQGYLSHPENIFKIWEGGLASHGAAVVILIALFYYAKKVVLKPYIWILDRISAPIAIAGTFIRLGNLVNHEMVGVETNLPWGFKFMNHDCHYIDGCDWDTIPVRHPAQLYEAICYFISFLVLMYFIKNRKSFQQPGLVFGLFLILIFGARFLVEFVKIGQNDNDNQWILNTGQLLSIPLVLAGVFLVYKAVVSNRK